LMRLSTLPAAIALAAFSASVPASALDRHDIQGIWRHPDTGSLIQIYSCGGGICAKVVSTVDPNLKDVKNPDPALRDRPVAGLVIWQHPKESGDLQWIGSAYNTADGGTYYGTMLLTSPATLAVSSCNLSVMLCADQVWTKSDPQSAKAILAPVSQPKAAPAAPTPAAPVQAAATPAAPVPAATAPAAPVRAAPKPAAVKPRQPAKKAAEKPKAPLAVVEEKPREVTERPRDPNGYEDLPHIHIR
jgi:uncharacterized protein (DUF2147 family)